MPWVGLQWGVIKVSAMSWGSFRKTENKALQPGQRPNTLHEIKEGDLLISRANTADLVGATVLVGECRPRLLLSDKSLRLVTIPDVSRPWLNYALRAPGSRLQFVDRATGTSDSMRNLSQDKILMTTLRLPPFEEQEEIARRVDHLYRRIDELEGQLEPACQLVERTSQAVLAKALRGDLVG
jgi:type I restriction enzyme S subunit